MTAPLAPIVAHVSGSIGDTVYSHNQHGPYTRARTTPFDPNTQRLMTSRRNWGRTIMRWGTWLTPAQRHGWCEYAAREIEFSPSPRRVAMSGQQAFVRANMARVGSPLGWRHDPPTRFDQTLWAAPFTTFSQGLGFVLFSIDNTDEWANTDFAGMWVFVSDRRPSTVNFYKAPFRRAKLVRGFAASPPGTTQWLSDPWGATGRAQRWLRSYVVLGDGRVASPRILPLEDNV